MSIHTAVLLLGSNVENCEVRLRNALDSIDRIAVRRTVSPITHSADVAGLGNDYANITAVYDTSMNLNEFCEALCNIEKAAGRVPSSKYTGIMPLDIDVVIWDSTIVSPDDYHRPYFVRP